MHSAHLRMHSAHLRSCDDVLRVATFKPEAAASNFTANFGKASASSRLQQWAPLSVCRTDSLPHDACPDDHLGLTWGPHTHSTDVSASAAVATAPRTASNEEEIGPWRLDGLLRSIRGLKKALAKANGLDQKLQILDRSSRVKATFGCAKNASIPSNGIISLALEALDDYEFYLLKCLVAAGQEHVLQSSPLWLNQFDKLGKFSQNGTAKHVDLGMCGMSKTPQIERGAASGRKAAGSAEGSLNAAGHAVNGSARNVVKQALPINNEHSLGRSHLEASRSMLKELVKTLHKIESFYNSLGGIIGYQETALELIKCAEVGEGVPTSMHSSGRSSHGGATTTRFSAPVGPDLSKDKDYASQAAVWGLQVSRV